MRAIDRLVAFYAFSPTFARSLARPIARSFLAVPSPTGAAAVAPQIASNIYFLCAPDRLLALVLERQRLSAASRRMNHTLSSLNARACRPAQILGVFAFSST